MADHRERACAKCGSYLHHEDDCGHRGAEWYTESQALAWAESGPILTQAAGLLRAPGRVRDDAPAYACWLAECLEEMQAGIDAALEAPEPEQSPEPVTGGVRPFAITERVGDVSITVEAPSHTEAIKLFVAASAEVQPQCAPYLSVDQLMGEDE